MSGPQPSQPDEVNLYQTPTRWARYPLTAFDGSFERSTFLTGWLVKGVIDTKTLSHALRRLTEKWRVLAGRLESVEGTKNWQIAVPLSVLPERYRTFVLTETTSDVPLSNYISLPLPAVSDSLPQSLFLHASTPRQNLDWVTRDNPLTCWHVTHFPSRSASEPAYSCVGFARSHGVFDGIGAATVMKALVAEMRGNEWKVPLLPPEGHNPNPIIELLNRAAPSIEGVEVPYSPLGLKGSLWLVGWHLRERYWRGATHQIFVMPQECISLVVEPVKGDIRTISPDLVVTTGDVLVAWFLKVLYASGTAAETVVHCSNFANFRDLIQQAGGKSLDDYPHNAFLPLPYPTLTVQTINSTPLPELTQQLCASRHSLSLSHVAAAHHIMTTSKLTMPVHQAAQDTLVISNVSASRIFETDWSPVSSEGTICSYRFSATPNNLVFGNGVYISGRLSDGSTVLDVNLNAVRMENLARAIGELKSRLWVESV
ncbi:hypothetical protein MIND_00687300 [Mycena indigotica]|uniref:Uncharacterized protein n=1 Tax=Mycena indigotica TaxID=2126181 RepID=A0A8H6SNT6_9AGAR|nr:uncharacterized protein MIND_00687300 [Mycena indigotica]KAF7301225.1 hypothetical protein MIND_00687300 [Mycena indigotica]